MQHLIHTMKNHLKNLNLKLWAYALGLLFLTGCASREDIVYFQGTPSEMEAMNYSPTLQPDDQLAITISAMDFEATKPFNLTNYYYNSQDPERRLTYLIDENGEIDYPVLGKLKLGGLTRIEAMDLMKEKLSEYIVQPGVNIEIVNFKVTVLGEVAKPGTFTVENERVTVLEALGMAGDLTINGVRKNVMVIRETPEKKEFYHLDLTSGDLVNSPVYYLKQNDVVYVEPNKAQINSSTYSRNTSIIISIASLVITVISVLTR